MRRPQSPMGQYGIGAVCFECHRLGLRQFVVLRDGRSPQVWQHCDHCGLHYSVKNGFRPGVAERLMAIGLIEREKSYKPVWHEAEVKRHFWTMRNLRKHRRRAEAATTPFPNTPTQSTKPSNSMDGPGPLTFLQPELENDNPAGPVSGQSSSDRHGTMDEKGLMESSPHWAQDQAPAPGADHLKADPI
jgi:hypothetical protein